MIQPNNSSKINKKQILSKHSQQNPPNTYYKKNKIYILTPISDFKYPPMDHLSMNKAFRLETDNKIKIQYSITEMMRISNNIYGYAYSENMFLQIDTKHIGAYPFKLSEPLRGVKYLHNDDRKGYYLVSEDCIRYFDISEGEFLFGRQQFSGRSMKNKYDKENKQNSYFYKFLITNDTSQFTGVLNGNRNNVIFSKYHKNHDKFSINIVNLIDDQQSNSSKKKILKLQDNLIGNMHISQSSQDIYYQSNNIIKQINIKQAQYENIISKRAKFLAQRSKLYIFDATNNKNSSQIAIFDIKTNKYIQFLPLQNRKWFFDDQIQRKEKEQDNFNLVIPILQNKKKSTKEKHYRFSVKQKKRNQLPVKIQSLKHLIIVGFQDEIQFWDSRKAVQPFCTQKQQFLSSFYYEPNLAKIYTSSSEGINVYNIK